MTTASEIRDRVEATAGAHSAESLASLLRSVNPSAPESVDPNALDDVINNYTERFDRLQFLFLEQEAKEQFFRLVLEQNDSLVDAQAIMRVMAEAKEQKSVLDGKASQLKLTTEKIQQLARTFHDLYDKSNVAYDCITATEAKLEKNRAELAELTAFVKSHEKDDPTMDGLSQVSQHLPPGSELSTLANVEHTLKLVKLRRLECQRRVEEISQQITKMKDVALKNEQRSKRLLEEDKRLNQLIEDMKRVDNQLDGEQRELLAQEDKLSILTEIWCDLYEVSDFKVDGDTIRFKFDKSDQVIAITTGGGVITGLSCDGVSDVKLEQIVKSANESATPLNLASTRLYELL